MHKHLKLTTLVKVGDAPTATVAYSVPLVIIRGEPIRLH